MRMAVPSGAVIRYFFEMILAHKSSLRGNKKFPNGVLFIPDNSDRIGLVRKQRQSKPVRFCLISSLGGCDERRSKYS